MLEIGENNNKKKTGFTLVELLATIAVLAIVVSIVGYVIINVIDNTRENSYKIVINDIEKEANSYLSENSGKLFFIPIDNIVGSNEYQCVTVQNLIDRGYFKKDVLDSYITDGEKVSSNDYVYLERDDQSKTLLISKYVNVSSDNEYSLLCGGVIDAEGSIAFDVSPRGWSQSKEVVIYYKVKNVMNYDDIQYLYKYVPDGDSGSYLESDSFVKEITVTENGTIYGEIPGIVDEVSLDISGIDNVKPVISMGDYTGKDRVVNKVTVPLVVTDKDSGFNKNTFDKNDILVIVGNTELDISKELILKNEDDGKYYYEVLISDIPLSVTGDLKLKIDSGTVEDNVENFNDMSEFDTGIDVVNTFTVNYHAGTGSGSMTSTSCTYNSSCTLRSNSFTRTGFAFNGWSNSAGGTMSNGQTFTYTYTSDITLTANWRDTQAPTAPTTMNFVYGDWSVYSGGWTGNDLYAGRTQSSKGPTGATDNVGVTKYQISTDNSTWYDFNYDITATLYKMSTTGTHKRYFRACDAAGNCGASLTVTGYIDKTAPSTPSISNPSGGAKTCYAFALTLSTTDEHSGVAYWQYSYSSSASTTGSDNTSTWVTYSNSNATTFTTTNFSASRNQYVYIRACDNAGNCSSKASTKIYIGTWVTSYSCSLGGSHRSGTKCWKSWTGTSASNRCYSNCPGTCSNTGGNTADSTEYTCYYNASSSTSCSG